MLPPATLSQGSLESPPGERFGRLSCTADIRPAGLVPPEPVWSLGLLLPPAWLCWLHLDGPFPVTNLAPSVLQMTRWLPDHLAAHCYACDSAFWLASRKHHCRCRWGVCGGMGQGVGAEIWPVELVDWRNAGIWLAVFCLRQTPGPTGLQFKLCCP